MNKMSRTTISMRALRGATLTATAMLLLGAWYTDGEAQQGGPPRQTATVVGQELPGLSAADQALFDDGRKTFTETETRVNGLGPVFNGVSCAECHKAGAIGGAGLDLGIARVTRIGGMVHGVYSDLTSAGGPVIQARSLKEFDTSCPIVGEVVPPQANYVSHRITTPLFGDGLIEAIPAAAILAQTTVRNPDGIQGTANMVYNPETGATEVGRFGWKAQHSTIHLFAGDAYLNEMGVTNPSFPTENLPQGRPIPPGWGSTGLEDDGTDVQAFTDFIRLLAPPGRRLPVTPAAQYGEQVFNAIHCSACHVSSLRTGPNARAALANQAVPLYSDLLLHHMGAGLADGVQQGNAKGDQFRTAPLWGLSRRIYYLHDGRATTYGEAIRNHAGEAAAASSRYAELHPADREALLEFLNSL